MNDELFTDFDEVVMEESNEESKGHGRRAVVKSISALPEVWDRLAMIGKQVGIPENRSGQFSFLVWTYKDANREEPAQ